MSENSTIHQVYMTARDGLIRMVSRLVPPKEIEDIVQETYVKVCQLDDQTAIQQPKSFLYATARNLAYDHLKRAENRLTDSTEDDQWDAESLVNESDDTFHQVATHQEFGHFCEAVRLLPVQCRRAFVLKKVYGYSQKEIARELGISQSTVEKHIAQGIKRCAIFMQKRQDTMRLKPNTNVRIEEMKS